MIAQPSSAETTRRITKKVFSELGALRRALFIECGMAGASLSLLFACQLHLQRIK